MNKGDNGMGNFFVLTGMPRSGTTYLSAVLYNPPKVVTLSEAQGKWRRLYKQDGVNADPLPIFQEFYQQISAGEAIATLEDTPGFKGEGRVDTWNQKKGTKAVEVVDRFVLGLKNPEVFLEWLPYFHQHDIKCLISIRHPVSVINSWSQRGARRTAKGKDITGTFANGDAVSFTATAEDKIQRQIQLYNFFVERIRAATQLPNIRVVRYEDWFSAPQESITKIVEFLGIEHSGELRPEPMLPDAPTLPPEAQEQILAGCTAVQHFGYPMQGDRLEPLNLPTNA